MECMAMDMKYQASKAIYLPLVLIEPESYVSS
jgi:hypothetical protein